MVGVYTRLLRLYPPSFRARFGEEMLQVVRDEARQGGVRWMQVLADLVASAAVERVEEVKMSRTWLIFPVGIVVALIFPVLVTGTEFSLGTLLVLLAELAVAGIIGGLAYVIGRRGRGAEIDYARRTFRWWWVLAALIGVTEVVFITAQFVREPKGTNLFAMVVVCGFAGLVFGGLALRHRPAGNWMIVAGVVPVMTLFWSVIPPIVALVVIVNALADNVRMARPRAAV
jgi:hypothetical protein